MPSGKLITVIGATGKQGGSVVHALLSSTQGFSIRGVTRDISKPAAKALQDKGVDVVAADINDKDSLVNAFKNSYGVFAVTNYWEKLDGKLEEQQGRNMVDVAKEAGVQHFVWSTLDNVEKISAGRLKHVYHFDGKARIYEYAQSVGLPTTAFMPGMYMSGIPSFGFLHPTDNDTDSNNGSFTFSLPGNLEQARLPLLDAETDSGMFVRAIFERPETSLGMRVLAASDYYSPQRIVDEFKATFPHAVKTVGLETTPDEAFKAKLAAFGLPEFAQQEMLENSLLLSDVGYYGGESLEKSHELLGQDKPTTWIEFIKKNEAYKSLA